MESRPMNEFGEPNMGNPSVRFDEGPERAGHWPLAFQSILSRLLYSLDAALGGRVLLPLRAAEVLSYPGLKDGERDISLRSEAHFSVAPRQRSCSTVATLMFALDGQIGV